MLSRLILDGHLVHGNERLLRLLVLHDSLGHAQALCEGQAQAEDPGEAEHDQAGVERGVPAAGARARAPAPLPAHV